MTGKFDSFDGSLESWSEYQERLEQHFLANDVDQAEKKRALLLSLCGRMTFKLARNLCAPAKLSDKTFEEICYLLKNHFEPQTSEIVRRFQFNNRVRRAGETVSQFLAGLKDLSEHCNYGAALNDMLRDRLVCGINDHHIQRRLLAESSLTLHSAIDIAMASESAANSCKVLGEAAAPPNSLMEVQHVSEDRCRGCQSDRHPYNKCPFREKRCFNCNRTGHISKICRQRRRQQPEKRQLRAYQLNEEAELDPPPGPRLRWLDEKLSQHAFVVLLFYRGFW